MVTDKQVLAKATEIFSRPAKRGFGWAKGTLAQAGNGRSVPVESGVACKFCSIGGLRRAAFELGISINHSAVRHARDRLDRVMKDKHGSRSIVSLNDADSTTLPQILFAFDFAQTEAGDA